MDVIGRVDASLWGAKGADAGLCALLRARVQVRVRAVRAVRVRGVGVPVVVQLVKAAGAHAEVAAGQHDRVLGLREARDAEPRLLVPVAVAIEAIELRKLHHAVTSAQ